MDKLHFDDLTKITCPFGLLDEDTQQRLRNLPHGGEFLAWEGEWISHHALGFIPGFTYRARPAPLEPDYVDWSQVAEPFNWHARDEIGNGFFFKIKPVVGYRIWDCPSGGWCQSSIIASYRRGTVDWRDSLISRPGVEG